MSDSACRDRTGAAAAAAVLDLRIRTVRGELPAEHPALASTRPPPSLPLDDETADVDAPGAAAIAQRRVDSDQLVRAIVRAGLLRNGGRAVARHLGKSQTLLRGYASEHGLAIPLWVVLAAPRGFAKDVLSLALEAVCEDVPSTLDDLHKLATTLLLACSDLLRLVEQSGASGPDERTQRGLLVILDTIERLVAQIRQRLRRPPPSPPAPSSPNRSPHP